MTEFFEEFERTKRRVLEPIRNDVGWPEAHDEYERIDTDLMWRYIEALENALAAERHLAPLLGPRPRP